MDEQLKILNGERGEEAQERALWEVISAQINIAFDMLRVITEDPRMAHISHGEGHTVFTPLP
jgi:hypothetical protein